MGNTGSDNDEHEVEEEGQEENDSGARWLTAFGIGAVGAAAIAGVLLAGNSNSKEDENGPRGSTYTANHEENNTSSRRRDNGFSSIPSSAILAEENKNEGIALLKKAFEADNGTTQDRSNEAKILFVKSLEKFKKAKMFKNSPEIATWIKIVEIKMIGNQLFNKGQELERMNVGEEPLKVTMSRYRNALNCYQEAKEKFKEGLRLDARFSSSINQTKKAEENVQQVLFTLSCKEAVFHRGADNRHNDNNTSQRRHNNNMNL